MKLSNDAASEARGLMARFDHQPSHPLQVHRLACMLFQELSGLHQLDDNAEILLQCAALLHDTGWSRSPDGSGHHKHSAKIVREHPWRSLPPDAVEIVAQVARYHRKSPPRPSHKAYRRLRGDDQALVRALAAILRLADALDRSHLAAIHRVEVRVAGGTAHFIAQTRESADEEAYGFAKKKDLFESHFGVNARLEIVEKK
jgi:exopolyphosphatase/guanosine-5'-triphosphate,3'-diphosphate pyrophosphatase